MIDAFAAEGDEAFLWDGDVKGFGVRAKPTGSKSFVLKYRVGSKTRRHTICKVGSPYTVDQAREHAAGLLRGLRNGIDPQDAKAEARAALTVGQLGDAYLLEGPALKPNKKASSWANDRSALTRHIKPLLGGKLLPELTKAHVSRFQADVAAGKTAADVKTGPRGRAVVTGGPRAASHATVILTAMLGFAVETGRLASNPAEGLSKIKLKSRERFLSEQEVVAIAEALAVMEVAGQLSRTMADALRLLLLTGARKTEVLSLEWRWVDFDHSCLRLPDSKTGAKVIPLPAPALELLSDRPRASGATYVFPAAFGDSFSVGLPKAWDRVKAKASLIARQHLEEDGADVSRAPDLSDVRLHDLRHSYASFAVADGASLSMIGKVLGHRSTRTTEIYAHLSADPVRAAVERTGARIAEAMKPRRTAGNVVRLPVKAG